MSNFVNPVNIWRWLCQFRSNNMSISIAAPLALYPGTQIFEFDSSTRSKTYRVELSDGRHFQINEKLYHLLECLRVPRSLVELGLAYQQRTGQSVAIEQLEQVSTQLTTQGLLIMAGQPPVPPNPSPALPKSLVALHYHRELFSAATLAPFTKALQIFFHKPVAIALTILFAISHLLAYAQIGYPPNVPMDAVSWPLFAVIMLGSIMLHELGHLAACRRWQCPHGPLGFGLYFFNPVFYADVTAAWRLTRQQRTVVDLAGVYLELLCVPLCLALYWLSHDPTYMMVIVVTDLVILSNFEPFMKLDGYWLLSDITGVPNLHTRAGEIVKQGVSWLLWRFGWRVTAPAASAFGEWSPVVRMVILVYVGLSVAIWPVMVGSLIPLLFDAVTTYPALWQKALGEAAAALQHLDMILLLAQLKALSLPLFMLLNLGIIVKLLLENLRKARLAR
jgi:putative peptide zinc metalloprotease protein